MTNDELLSKTISYLRFPLMVGIVFIHFNISDGIVLHGVTYGADSPYWYHCIINIFSDVFPRIGVPLFFFISGFLFFYHTDFNAEAYKKKLKSRVNSLFVPFILWNLIFIAYSAFRLLPFMARFFPNAYKTQIDLSLPAILQTFWNAKEGIFIRPIEDLTTEINNSIYPIDVPLWYVRDLMIAIICAPILYWLIRKTGKYFIILLGIAWYATRPFDFGHPNQLLTAFFFFSWGAWHSINRQDFVRSFRKLSSSPLLYAVLALADTLTKETTWNCYIHSAGIIVGIIAAVVVTANLLEKGKIRTSSFLANGSFFIFALHTLFMGDLSKVIFIFAGSQSPVFLLFLYFFVPISTTLICLGLYKGLKTYFPTCAKLLTGGR